MLVSFITQRKIVNFLNVFSINYSNEKSEILVSHFVFLQNGVAEAVRILKEELVVDSGSIDQSS